MLLFMAGEHRYNFTSTYFQIILRSYRLTRIKAFTYRKVRLYILQAPTPDSLKHLIYTYMSFIVIFLIWTYKQADRTTMYTLIWLCEGQFLCLFNDK